MATGANWRVGDAEREAVAGQLREHYAARRLTMDDFRARLDAAYSATTPRELALVTADLPSAGADWPGARSPSGSGPVRASGSCRPSRTRRRHRRRLVSLLVFAALVAGSVALLAWGLPVHAALAGGALGAAGERWSGPCNDNILIAPGVGLVVWLLA